MLCSLQINSVVTENVAKIMTKPEGSHIVFLLELTPSVVSEKDWNTKEDNYKSMMCVLYVLQLVKKHISE